MTGCQQQVLFGASELFCSHGSMGLMLCLCRTADHIPGLWACLTLAVDRLYQYVIDEGDTGGQAVGNDQSVVGRWSPASGRFHLVDEFQRVNTNRLQMPQPRPLNLTWRKNMQEFPFFVYWTIERQYYSVVQDFLFFITLTNEWRFYCVLFTRDLDRLNSSKKKKSMLTCTWVLSQSWLSRCSFSQTYSDACPNCLWRLL